MGGAVVEEAAAHEVAEHTPLHGAYEPLGVFGAEADGLVEAERAVASLRSFLRAIRRQCTDD